MELLNKLNVSKLVKINLEDSIMYSFTLDGKSCYLEVYEDESILNVYENGKHVFGTAGTFEHCLNKLINE